MLIQGLLLLAAVRCVSCATYSLSSNLTGQSFLDAFTWSTNPDQNWGRVTYVDYDTAVAKDLVSVSAGQVMLRADSTTKLNASGPGRDSFDLVSKNKYTTHLAIFDIQHMPEGCGTWPAICKISPSLLGIEYGDNWPNNGEIDIVEGVNNQSPDSITLHTSAGCTMPASRQMTGTAQTLNCDAYATNNEGCGVKSNKENSYGPGFNDNDGGWYVIERTTSHISVYFWSRDDASVPTEVSMPGTTISTDTWQLPVAYFPSSIDCDFKTHLGPHKIVINLDFCGAWAGNSQVYNAAKCPSTCSDFVNSNPEAFKDAYFTINSMTIFE